MSVPLVVLAIVLAVALARGAEPPTLEDRAAAIERVSTERDGARVVIGHLSRKLQMPVDELRRERQRTGLGWGELLIANLVSRTAGLTVDQVAGEFRSGKSWEDIARTHHVNLETLAEDVDRTQETVEQREEDRAPTVTQGNGSKHPGSTGHPRGDDAGAGTGRGRRY
jgi:hypothetical protein